MGRMYSVSFKDVVTTGAVDLIEINAPSDAVVILHRVVISQNTEVGDTEAEMLEFLIHRGSTSGSGGSTPTPSPLEVGDAGFGGTTETGNTSQGTEGTIIHYESCHVAAGLDFHPTPECRPVISPSGRIIVELMTAPADSVTLDGTAYFEEIGG